MSVAEKLESIGVIVLGNPIWIVERVADDTPLLLVDEDARRLLTMVLLDPSIDPRVGLSNVNEENEPLARAQLQRDWHGEEGRGEPRAVEAFRSVSPSREHEAPVAPWNGGQLRQAFPPFPRAPPPCSTTTCRANALSLPTRNSR